MNDDLMNQPDELDGAAFEQETPADEPVTALDRAAAGLEAATSDVEWLDSADLVLSAEDEPLIELPEQNADLILALDAEPVGEIPDENAQWIASLKTANAQAEADFASGTWGVPKADASQTELAAESPATPLEDAVTEQNNAPTWLNDMVPGLDIDFDATEEEQLEPSTAQRMRKTHDYDWLIEMVDEESQHIVPVAAPEQARPPRFAFTKPPVWLRNPQEGGDQSPDVPSWLQ